MHAVVLHNHNVSLSRARRAGWKTEKAKLHAGLTEMAGAEGDGTGTKAKSLQAFLAQRTPEQLFAEFDIDGSGDIGEEHH
jgi:hypothetical protein